MKKMYATVLCVLFIAGALTCKKESIPADTRARVDTVKLNAIFKKFKQQEQIFEVDEKERTVITGKKGTRIIIEPDSLELPKDFNADEGVSITLIEQLDSLDLAMSGVELTYIDALGNKVPFESAGMFRINAEYKGKAVPIKKGKKIKIQFPNVEPGERYMFLKMEIGNCTGTIKRCQANP